MTPGDQKHIMDVSLFESGEVILKIWDDGVYHFKEDYIKFHVEHLIYPNKVCNCESKINYTIINCC